MALPQRRGWAAADHELPVQGVQYCDKLFVMKRCCRQNKFSFEKRYEFRNRKAPEILKVFRDRLEKQHSPKGSQMEKTVTYPYKDDDVRDLYFYYADGTKYRYTMLT